MSNMLNKKNILYTSHSGDYLGGGQKSLFLLFQGLDQSKYQIYLMCPQEGGFSKDVQALGGEVIISSFGGIRGGNVFRMFSLVKDLKNIVKNNEIKCIHTDSARATFYLGWVSKILKVPLIWHVRVANPDPFLYEMILYYFATRIIAVSKAVCQKFKYFMKINNKVHVIYNAIDDKDVYDVSKVKKIKEELGLGETDSMIGMTGQLIPEKGVEDLLMAVKCIQADHPSLRCLLVGEAEDTYQKFLKDKIEELAIGDNIIFMGFRSDVFDVLHCLNIFVLPTRLEEGLSRSVLEAMKVGLPVIATDKGSNSEVIVQDKTGIIVPEKDPVVLSQAIDKLLKDSNLCKQLGLRAQERVKEIFSLSKNAQQVGDLYKELLW